LGNNRIFAVDILDEIALSKAVLLKADIIISNERVCDISGQKDIRFINSEVYRIPGTFSAYAYNRAIVDRLYSKAANSLIINRADVLKAIPKMVYWSNSRIGYLHACIEENKLDEADMVYIEPYLPARKTREAVKYIRTYLSNNVRRLFHRQRSVETVIRNRKIGLLVNDEFELGVFEYLIKEIPAADLVIFSYGNINFEEYAFVKPETGMVNLGLISKFSFQPFLNPFKLSAEELGILNFVIRDWQKTSIEIEQYRCIGKTSIDSLIINVGENLPLRNLMPDIFKGRIRVYNTMNGIKSGEAHDGDVNFHKWFVWDEKMKQLLVEKCSLAPGKLSVTGHLMKDFILDYKFSDSLGMDTEMLKGKKVISIFSVRGNREEKQEAFKYIYELIERDNSYFALVRPHPLEKEKDFMLPPEPSGNVHFVMYDWKNSKQTLYDQIYMSDIGIVFGSTVAIECEWMKVPSATFEKKEISNVYCIDNVMIKHIRSIGELQSLLGNLEKRPVVNPVSPGSASVAKKIMDVIRNDQDNL
jgi:hypothetical protein